MRCWTSNMNTVWHQKPKDFSRASEESVVFCEREWRGQMSHMIPPCSLRMVVFTVFSYQLKADFLNALNARSWGIFDETVRPASATYVCTWQTNTWQLRALIRASIPQRHAWEELVQVRLACNKFQGKTSTQALPSKYDGTNTVPHLYHFLPVSTGSTGYRSTVQKRYCFSIGFHYWPVPFIRYWTIPFSYKHPIQRHNCT